MALKDIINSIADDATKQVAAIKQENEKQLTQIKEHWQEEVAQQRQVIKRRWQLEAERKVNQSALKLKASAQNKVLMEKQSMLDEVFAKSLDKLADLSEAKYIELLVGQLNALPPGDGKLSSTKGKSALLKKALNKSGRKYQINKQEIEGTGGFVFETEQYSVDSRFEHLLELKRDELRVALGAILFSRNEEK